MRFDYNPDYPPVSGKMRDEQIAHISTWDGVPDDQRTMARLTTIHIIPNNGSTETLVNPLDPGNPATPDWAVPPPVPDRVIPAGRML